MTTNYAVTFEFDMRPPVTHRGSITASAPSTASARAIRAAQKELKPVGWSSMVCVLLDRASAATPEAT